MGRGKGHGTGYPLTLRCTKCKVGRDWRRDSSRGTNLEATGRTRRLKGSKVGPRCVRYQIEYRCRDCGHVGWSKHKTALRLLRRVEPTANERSPRQDVTIKELRPQPTEVWATVYRVRLGDTPWGWIGPSKDLPARWHVWVGPTWEKRRPIDGHHDCGGWDGRAQALSVVLDHGGPTARGWEERGAGRR